MTKPLAPIAIAGEARQIEGLLARNVSHSQRSRIFARLEAKVFPVCRQVAARHGLAWSGFRPHLKPHLYIEPFFDSQKPTATKVVKNGLARLQSSVTRLNGLLAGRLDRGAARREVALALELMVNIKAFVLHLPTFGDDATVAYKRYAGQLFVQGTLPSGDWGENRESSSIHISDVSQGYLGDCWLLAALAAIAKARPEHIRKIVKGSDGRYRVTLHFNGKPTTLVVDDFFPSSGRLPTYAKPQDSMMVQGKKVHELWVMLVEKAFAQSLDNYPDMERSPPARGLRHLTGQSTRVYLPRTMAVAALQRVLSGAWQKRWPTAFRTPLDDADMGQGWQQMGLTPRHCYALMGVRGTGFRIYNPHGDPLSRTFAAADIKKHFDNMAVCEYKERN